MNAIGKKINHLRKEAGMTQEKLADMLGVSAGAVSKWERSRSYPDIVLLAPLARTLHVSLDELLCFQTDITKEEIKTIKQQMIAKFGSIGYEQTVHEITQYLHKYPQNMNLKLSMASVLYMNLIYLENETDRKKYIVMIQKLIEEVLDSKCSELYMETSYLYAILLMDNEEFEKAESVLHNIASSSIDVQSLYLNLYIRQNKQEELIGLTQKILLEGLMKMSSALSIMAKNDDEHFLQLLKDCDDLYTRYQFSYRQPMRALTQYYLTNQQLDKAAKSYAQYIDSVLAFPYNHKDNPYLNRLTLEYNETAQKQMRIRLLESELQDETLHNLKGHPIYQKTVTSIQTYLNENDC